MYLAYNKYKTIVATSDKPFEMEDCTVEKVNFTGNVIGKQLGSLNPLKPMKDLKVACICNWNDACGISTYTKYLMDAITKQVAQVKIFSEHNDKPTFPDDERVERCWKRGQSMADTVKKIIAWNPDLVIVQHEFGIFPKAGPFLQMLQMLEPLKYAVTLHSVYEHLDKTICTSAIKNIIVHSQEAKNCLRKLGHNQNIFVLPHGCLKLEHKEELWNIFQTPYVLVQFGFGFFYKGVDRAIEAISILKKDPKFHNVFYVYLCSDSGHFDGVHNHYFQYLNDKIEKLGVQDNVAVIRKFHTEETINTYLRTAKIALFPYTTDPKHVVYGASGAVRMALSNEIPTIASESHMFDDLEGVLPRPKNAENLAKEIDEIFSNDKHKEKLLKIARSYVDANTWDIVAKKYLQIYQELS